MRAVFLWLKVGGVMKCPYATNQQTIIQTKMEYDENGEQRICTEVQNSKAEFIDCLRTRCQVYYDGKCHYKD